MTWDSVMVGVDTPSQVVRVGLTLISSLTGPGFGGTVRSKVPGDGLRGPPSPRMRRSGCFRY